ncbi:hypothetical protein [Moraxella lacunata]|uniref:hypothetical protein n=1 Tax=Moraxella lacunata TaxID=477 RepID=UPI000A896652|nr:hypothetical protein [Moraxella lacunata]
MASSRPPKRTGTHRLSNDGSNDKNVMYQLYRNDGEYQQDALLILVVAVRLKNGYIQQNILPYLKI